MSSIQGADTFNYERWLAEDSGKLLQSFVPFSVGPRACIGRKYVSQFAALCVKEAIILTLG